MDSINNLIDDVLSVDWEIPVSLKITFLVLLVIFISVIIYFYRDSELFKSFGDSYMWVYLVIIINILNLILVLYYYNYVGKTKIVGPAGLRGKSGKKGSRGKFLSCSYCKNNLYLTMVKKSDKIAEIKIYDQPATKIILDNLNYLDNLLDNDNIDYSQFVDVVLRSTLENGNDNVVRMLSLMNTDALKIISCQYLNNELGKGKKDFFGTFNRPYGKVGYLPLGDSVLGAYEQDLQLNYFMVSGDTAGSIRYPSSYEKIVSFPVEVNSEGSKDTITIWSPNGPVINRNPGITSNASINNQLVFNGLGDIAHFGMSAPKNDIIFTISEDCLELVPDDKLELVFIYSGITSVERNTPISARQSEFNLSEEEENPFAVEVPSFQIPVNNSIAVLFSVWRTPMNTFITNSPGMMFNNTIAYNIYNGKSSQLNEIGAVSLTAKQNLIKKLRNLNVSKLMVTSFILQYYDIMNKAELRYYISKYADQNPDLTSYRDDMTTGEMLDLIEQAELKYKNFIGNPRNAKLIKKNAKPPVPLEVKRVYEKVNKNVLAMPFEISNTNSMYELLLILFPSGIDTMISIDNDGDAMGGDRLNIVQQTFINICQILFPPNRDIYFIKDECLGTFQRNTEREDVITELEDVITENRKLIASYQNNLFLACRTNLVQVGQYYILKLNEIGSYVGHIKDWYSKIEKLQLDEFPTSKLKKIIEIYRDINQYTRTYCDVNNLSKPITEDDIPDTTDLEIIKKALSMIPGSDTNMTSLSSLQGLQMEYPIEEQNNNLTAGDVVNIVGENVSNVFTDKIPGWFQ